METALVTMNFLNIFPTYKWKLSQPEPGLPGGPCIFYCLVGTSYPTCDPVTNCKTFAVPNLIFGKSLVCSLNEVATWHPSVATKKYGPKTPSGLIDSSLLTCAVQPLLSCQITYCSKMPPLSMSFVLLSATVSE
jgi:hypothetical protein